MVTVASSSPALFALPGLTWAPDDLRVLKPPPGADPPALGAWSELESLELALLALDELMRALTLAGYVTTAVQIGVGGGAAPATWVQIDPALMEAAEVATGVDWPPGARCVIALQLEPRRTASLRSLAVPGPPLGAMPFAPGWSTEEPGALIYDASQPVADVSDLLGAIDASRIPTDVEQAVLALAGRWALGDLDPFGAGAAPGLLWIYDPRFWDTDPPAWTGADADFARGIAAKALVGASADPMGFVRAQVTAATRSALRSATLGGLLELAASRSEARNTRRDYYAALENLFVRAVEVGLGGTLDEGTFHDVCGRPWLGYPSRLRWLDVVLYLAESRLLAFPALIHPELTYDFEADVDPVDVVRTGDGLGVEIRVLGGGPIVLYQEESLGYPAEECFSWEYVEADALGIATLIVVAAPGVSVTGRETVLPSWRLVVYRIQDHDLVPPWGEHILTTLFDAPYDVAGLSLADAELFLDGDAYEGDVAVPAEGEAVEPAQPAFRVRPLPLGMRLTYPAVAGDEEIELTVDIAVDEHASDQRFTWEIVPLLVPLSDPPDTGMDLTQRQPHELVIRASPGVRIGVQRRLFAATAVTEFYQRAAALEGADPPGVPISRDAAVMLRRGVTPVADDDPHFESLIWIDYQWVWVFAQLGIDVGIGMIPVVGDAVDIVEFIDSFFTGTDRWGNPVTNFDRALMVGGILLPFVSSGVLRGVKAAMGP